MRNRYIVAYDIADPKRLRKTFLMMRGFGDPVQYSVFICELSLKEKATLISSLKDIINHNEDRIMIINLGWVDSDPFERIEFVGKPKEFLSRECVII
ncbi:MAG: CRISPR-associated endonuclease Cas2 [Thermoplasmataceae archaeon]